MENTISHSPLTDNDDIAPNSVVVNAFQEVSPGDESGVDLAKPFDLTRIKINYFQVAPRKTKSFKINSQANHFCYVVKGDGMLRMEGEGEELSETKGVTKDDCFSFPAQNSEQSYVLESTHSSEELGVIVFADPETNSTPAASQSPPSFPTIISAPNSNSWIRWGVHYKKFGCLTKQTDMSLGAPSMPNKKLPWNVNLDELPPGTQSSNAHCHSYEDEFTFVLSGKARYWHQGEQPERIVSSGDCIGWKAGTGISHNLINDGDGPNGEGESVVTLTWGDNDRSIDKIHYATMHPLWWSDDKRWFDVPKFRIGSAPSVPRHPRPNDI